MENYFYYLVLLALFEWKEKERMNELNAFLIPVSSSNG
jgi:hypothetical protein